MTLATVALLVLLVLLVSLLLLRRPRDDHSGLIQQQLIELRGRLEQLTAAQLDVPLALAGGRADQQKTLGELSARLGQLTEATRRLETVGASVAEVQQLLKVPKLRGTLGEIWLEDLLRQVFPPSHFAMQHPFRSGEKVDAVIKVGERLVPIDSKFPLEAFQRMLAADEDGREAERRLFRRTLKHRIDEIADKYIRPDEGTLDFALMYIPAENVYYEAVIGGAQLDDNLSIIGYALDRKVIPVSPNTFYAYLSAILHGLRSLKVEERAVEIRDALAGLQQQFSRFAKIHELVGTHLERAGKQYAESERQIEKIHLRLENITGVEGIEPVGATEPLEALEPEGVRVLTSRS